MTHLELELKELKESLLELANLTFKQLSKAVDAFQNMDLNLAQEVIKSERRVNAIELKIDRDCENIVALYNPVAIDLRLVFAVFKINSHLERIGDYAEGIARYVLKVKEKFSDEFLGRLQFKAMADTAFEMLSLITVALQNDNAYVARNVFEKDSLLDKINAAANGIISDEIRAHSDKTESLLHLLSIVQKLERVGDMSTNIAEEIIFYLEAKVLKHSKKDEKRNNPE